MNFTPDFFNVGENIEGNLSALGLVTEDIENRVHDMVQELKGYGLCVPAYLVTEKLDEYNIPYTELPQYLLDEIDTLEVF